MQLLSVRVKILNLIRRNNAFKSQHANIIRANINEYYFVDEATLCCFVIKAATFQHLIINYGNEFYGF